MWVLDPANSPALIERMRPHARRFELQVLWVGEGWRPLVEECHEQLAARFPDYELLDVKQKWGLLEFQALSRPDDWSHDESLAAITGEFARRSAEVCEWCGAPGVLRAARTLQLTLCDDCDNRFSDPPG